MRIMIAEDEPRAMRGLKSLIISLSEEYEIVAEASDGRAAMEMIQHMTPDVVFLDLKMPYMDGIGVIRASRAMSLNTEFVLVTAYEDFETAREAIVLNVFDYIVKPITIDDMKRVMDRLERKFNNCTDLEQEQHGCLKDQYPDAHPLIRKTLMIIEEGYASKLNQKDIAETLGISQEYLSFLFNKNVGEPFVKFLKQYRIKMAQKLLKEGIAKEELPYRVGFSDPKYFGKVFREVTGMSVTEYMRSQQLFYSKK